MQDMPPSDFSTGPVFADPPPRSSVILRPGMRAQPPGVERHVIDGGKLLVVAIEAGDRVKLTDLEGCQPCEIVTADGKGRIDLGMLGRKSNATAKGIRSALSVDDESARIVRRGLERRKIDLADVKCVRVFSADSPAGNTAEFSVERDGVLIICAPGEPMRADEHNTTTSIELRITRAKPKRKTGSAFNLPEPLADPLQDIRITVRPRTPISSRPENTSRSSMSTAGRCTDFQCFRSAQSR